MGIRVGLSCRKPSGELFEVESESGSDRPRGRRLLASESSSGPRRPGTSSKATGPRERAPAAKRTCTLYTCPEMSVCVVEPGQSRASCNVLLPTGVEPIASSGRTAAMAVVECRSSVPSSGRLPCDSRPGSKGVGPPLLPSYSDVCRVALGAGSPLGLSPSVFWGTAPESWEGCPRRNGFPEGYPPSPEPRSGPGPPGYPRSDAQAIGGESVQPCPGRNREGSQARGAVSTCR